MYIYTTYTGYFWNNYKNRLAGFAKSYCIRVVFYEGSTTSIYGSREGVCTLLRKKEIINGA